MRSRLIWVALCAAFGAAIEAIKAREGWAFDLRFNIGNISTLWIALPLVTGYRFRKASSLFALTSTVAALVGFYVALVFMFPHAWGTGGLATGLVQSFRAGSVWMACGIVSSPIAGAIGARIRQWRSVMALIGVMLLLEPFAMFAASHVTVPVIHVRWWFAWGWFAYTEIVLGAFLAFHYLRRGAHDVGANPKKASIR